MSARRALAIAVRDNIRSILLVKNSLCEVMFDGRPSPRFGTVGGRGSCFYAVHQGPRSNELSDPDDQTFCLDYHVIYVTLSMWCGPVPFDRIGTDLIDLQNTGFDPKMDALRAMVQKYGQTIRAAANTILGSLVHPITQPLVPSTDEPATAVDASWFGANPPENSNQLWVFGMKSQLSLVGARRPQSIEEVTG